jgi:hypothetical protein
MQRARSTSSAVTAPSRTRRTWSQIARAASPVVSGRAVACATKTPISVGV